MSYLSGWFSKKSLPRGVRNNNPMNIKRAKSNDWLGEVPESEATDSVFEQFVKPEYGIRAGALLIIRYYKKYKINTISKLVNKFAPKKDGNDTVSYTNFLCKKLGVSPDEPLDFTSYEVMKPLVEAIIEYECDRYRYPSRVVDKGLELAGVIPKKVDIVKTRSGRTAIGLGAAGLSSIALNDVLNFYSSVSWVSNVGGYLSILMFIIAILFALYLIKYRSL